MRDRGVKTGKDWDLRTIGVTQLGKPVHVDANPENWDGDGFSVVLAHVSPDPKPGSDELRRAEGECWVGRDGYIKDGKLQLARAFIGTLSDRTTDVFVVDIPEDITKAGSGPLEGTEDTYPSPPAGTMLRRVTHVGTVQGYVRSSADGALLVFCAKDAAGKLQLFSVATAGGNVTPVTNFEQGISSDACWHPTAPWLVVASGGRLYRVFPSLNGELSHNEVLFDGPLPGASDNLCFSPDGARLAMNINVAGVKQIFVLERTSN
jgi:hypothetical protein